MPSDMAQGEALEPINGLCEEAAGESWLSLLSHPAEILIKQIAHPPFFFFGRRGVRKSVGKTLSR